MTAQADGSFRAQLDDHPPCTLPPMLGRLLGLLAENSGKTIEGDPLVGFKSNGWLQYRLDEYARIHWNKLPSRSRRSNRLNQALFELRRRMSRVCADGELLVQVRRGEGYRLAVRRP